MALVLTLLALLGTIAAIPARAQSGRIVVAIVDSGVTPSKALAKHLVPGWDLVDNDAKPTDGYGHGTELAGIVAAQCPNCSIMPVRVLGNGGLGSIPTVVDGIHWAVAHGAQVVNLSMTTPYEDSDLSTAIEWAVGQGVTVTVAAGNQGASSAYPGIATPDAIVVGSVDSLGQRFSWSNYGPWVNVVAPGSLMSHSLTGKLVSAIGTSASAAYVAARAGQLLSCSPTLPPAAVLQRLQSSLSVPSC
jgi:subtilisin family serine protease